MFRSPIDSHLTPEKRSLVRNAKGRESSVQQNLTPQVPPGVPRPMTKDIAAGSLFPWRLDLTGDGHENRAALPGSRTRLKAAPLMGAP